jgi:choline-sulfatase
MTGRLSRRELLGAGATAQTFLPRSAVGSPAKPPNFLFLLVDQLNLDAISAHGCRWARTPNMDRLVRSGVTFMESHSTNPVCSPARSSLLTGRMPVETGVPTNGLTIRQDIPNLGQWLSRRGYEAVYCGKWHLPHTWQDEIPGFTTIPMSGEGEGDMKDALVAMASSAYFAQRRKDSPFLMVSSLLQPHDICFWAIADYIPQIVPKTNPFRDLPHPLPALPPNNKSRPRAPKALDETGVYNRDFSDEQWRYYLYSYYRMVEMLDADIGRILDGLEANGLAEDTVVVLTSDHGEGAGRHGHVQKWTPYDESVRVPFVVSCPKRIRAGVRDATHLVSGLDVMSTLCDFAGADAPRNLRGRSLRPLLEGKRTEWREFVAAEMQMVGRMIRTERFKYVKYKDDPVEQLFDMKADPWETVNISEEAKYADEVRRHRALLQGWEAGLEPA